MIPATIRSRHSARRDRRHYRGSQAGYDHGLLVLAGLDFADLRAGQLDLMARYMDSMSANANRQQVTEDRHEAAELLRQVAATERGQVLISASHGPGEHHALWLWLARSRDHGERSDILAIMHAKLSGHISTLAAEVLFAVMRTEGDVSRITR